MLIRFNVENFLSFNDKIEFSMVAGKGRLLNNHIIRKVSSNDLNILKAAAIYGANASGKSNLVKAISFGKELILSGTEPKHQLPVTFFKLDKNNEKSPAKFQYDFKTNGIIYSYGFSLNKEKIIEEWLNEAGQRKLSELFYRKTDENEQAVIRFNNKLIKKKEEKDFLSFVAKGTRANQLFLTESAQRNVKYFKDAYDWFDSKLKTIFPESKYTKIDSYLTKENVKENFLKIIKTFDVGISNICSVEHDIDKTNIPEEIKNDLRKELKEGKIARLSGPDHERLTVKINEKNQLIVTELGTTHKVKNSAEEITFDLNEESDGTQRLFDLLPILTDLSDKENVYIIDEIDRSLHPHITKRIIELFLSDKFIHDNQLIFTTHESTLLDLKLLRKDEIWFIEKNESGESSVYSLEEFKPRYDKDVRKGYLLGRFHAIPSLGSLRNINK